MPAIGTFPIATEAIAGTVVRSPPTVVITAPSASLITTLVTVAWTYTSSVPRAQSYFRVELQTPEGTTLYNSGNVAGAGLSHLVPFTLSPFTSYLVLVSASDAVDEGHDEQLFLVEASTVADTDEEPRVGSVYEVGINGTGYMLADHPETEGRYRRQSGNLEPERFATGETPFSEAVERYTFLGAVDWTGGAGQRFGNLPESNGAAFWDSQGVNPFVRGQVTLLEAVTVQIPDTYTDPQLVVASDLVYVRSDANEIKSISTPGGSVTTFTPGTAGTGLWLASDGRFWYSSSGAAIQRNDSAAAPGSDWSAVAVDEIFWCADRLVGFDRADLLGENVTTFAPDGTEEVVDGRFKFPNGQSLRGACGGDGYLWFGANAGTTQGQVWAWQLGSTDGAFIGLSVPEGETVDNLYFYLGNVFLSTTTGHGRKRIYRCIPQDGHLTAEFVLDIDPDQAVVGQVQFSGLGSLLAFSWEKMDDDGFSGIGCFDLSSGGYARWYRGTAGTGKVPGVTSWKNAFAFTLEGVGLLTVAAIPTFLGTGYLESSLHDLGSGLVKVFDEISVRTEPLIAGESVAVDWTTNLSAYELRGLLTAPGTTSLVTVLDEQGLAFGTRITLNRTSAGDGPCVQFVQIKLHPLGLADQALVLPLRCGDRVKALNGTTLPGSGPGFGAREARRLEALVSSRVKVQDIDWPITGMAPVFDVVSADLETVGVFDRNLGRRSDEFVVTMTLRRAL